MHAKDVGAGPSGGRRPSWYLRVLTVLLLGLLAVALAGRPPVPLPSPELQLASTTNPTPPGGVAAASADRALVITWNSAGEARFTRYEVFIDNVLRTTSTSTSATVTGLVNGQTYQVAVRTVTTSFLGQVYEGARTVAIDGEPLDASPPAAPTGVTAVAGDGEVDITWVANGGDYDADGYRVLRNGVDQSGLLVGPGTTTWTDATVVNDTTYGYTVQTHDTSRNWSVSSAPVATATPTDLTAPAAPTGVVGGRGDQRAGLAWDPNSEPDLASYRVLRNGVEVASVTAANHLDLGLTNDTAYSYTVVAVDNNGNRSAPSAAVVVTPTDLTPPDAPTGLAAVRGDGQVSLSWTANNETDLASYRVLRNGAEVATVTGTSFLDTGLTNDVTYSYTLAAVDTRGNRSVSSSPPVPATPTDLGAPAIPTGLAALRGDSQVSLSWTANSEPDLANYRLLRDGLEIAVVVGTTSFVDAGLANDTIYSYTLAALDTHGNRSADSPAVTATPTDLTPPAAPTGLTAVKGGGQVTLSWVANSEPDLATYRVLRDGVEIATVTGTTYTTVANGMNRVFTLVAVDTHGNRSAASAPVTPADDVVPPAAPSGLTAARGDGRVTLTWTANSENDLASYRVLRGGVEIATTAGLAYVDTGRTNDVTYTYTLVAVDDSGNRSAASSPASATPTDLTAPAAPTGLVVSAGEGKVVLSWTANPEPDLASYRVLRGGVEIATVTGTTYTDTGLTNDVAYSYTLVAVDTRGNRSTASAPRVATPRNGPPAPPTAITATPGDRRAVISWTAPSDPDVASYRVLAVDGTTVVATATAPVSSATVPSLTNGTTYRFTVVAVDTAGNVSVPSAAVTVVPVSPTVPLTGAGERGGVAASSDGRFVVVGTRGQREASDTNTAYELYLFDRTLGTAKRIAPLPASATGDTDPTNSAAPAVSDDGRYVVLTTSAALLPADTNGLADIYRLDVTTGTRTLVSVAPAGSVNGSTAGTILQPGSSVHAIGPSVAISADGDLVLFYSERADLVAGDTNAAVDLFAKRLSTGVVTRVSTTTAGGNLSGAATGPAVALTPDGRFALFPAATGTGSIQLYRKTLSGAGAGELVVVSSVVVSGSTTQFAVYRDAGDIAMSDDGRFVAFVTAAKIMTATPGTIGGTGLAYRKDLVTNAVAALGSGQQTFWEHRVELDPTGRYGFFSTAASLVAGDNNGHSDHYRRDLDAGPGAPLVLVTSDAGGAATTGPIGAIAPTEYARLFAADGDRVLLLTSQALVSADTNRVRDLYAKDLVSGTVGSPIG